MKKALPVFVCSILCFVLAIRYFRPDFSWFAEASINDTGNMADMSQPLPHAVMPTVDGNCVDFESYRGKVLLINFWTTWCSGCQSEISELIKLQKEFQGKGFTLVAVAMDVEGEESVKTFVESERFAVDGTSTAINFPVLMGHDELARKMGFEGGLPVSVLVTRDSKEVRILRGPMLAKEVVHAIKHLL